MCDLNGNVLCGKNFITLKIYANSKNGSLNKQYFDLKT